MAIGLYIHVPFCQSKCNYCDFYSVPQAPKNEVDKYLEGISNEVQLYEEMLQTQEMQVKTLYLGGGTPTYLSSGQLQRLFQIIKRSFKLKDKAEITVEVNPNMCSLEKLTNLTELGVNRFSLGVQSFDKDNLKAMGRQHQPEQVEQFFKWCKSLNIDNVSIDLIYGLPEQKLARWKWELKQAALLRPLHISLYGLKLEPGTPWYSMNAKEQACFPDDEEQAAMYKEAIETLTACGYEHYEISNFALPGYRSKHNLTYWETKPYLGLGPGASSNLKGKRWSNVCDLKTYAKKLEGELMPIAEGEEITAEIAMWEAVALSLRLADGFSIENFEKRFAVDFFQVYGNIVDKLEKRELIERKENRFFLTTQGKLFGNEVFSELLP